MSKPPEVAPAQAGDWDGSPAVAPDQLARWLSAGEGSARVLLDVRWRLGAPPSEPDFRAGHIPGAQWVDLEADLADPPAPDRVGGRHPLPDPQRLQQAVRRWGIGPDSLVITYDDADGVAAARGWWVLRWAGLSRVAVLDGGLRAWLAAGGALETGPGRSRPAGAARLQPGRLPTMDAPAVAGVARDGSLLDVRAAERFRGEHEPVDPVAGHIPGARNVPAAQLSRPDGTLVDADAMAALLGSDVVDRLRPGEEAGRRVAAYCGSGVTAAHTVWALATRFGALASLYPGSWSDWVSDPRRPVAGSD